MTPSATSTLFATIVGRAHSTEIPPVTVGSIDYPQAPCTGTRAEPQRRNYAHVAEGRE